MTLRQVDVAQTLMDCGMPADEAKRLAADAGPATLAVLEKIMAMPTAKWTEAEETGSVSRWMRIAKAADFLEIPSADIGPAAFAVLEKFMDLDDAEFLELLETGLLFALIDDAKAADAVHDLTSGPRSPGWWAG